VIVALLVVVATATTTLLAFHIKWSLDGTYLRWAREAQEPGVDTVSKPTTTTERKAP
jgi:hypothetical protein